MNIILTLVVLLILVAAFAVAIPILQHSVLAKGLPWTRWGLQRLE